MSILSLCKLNSIHYDPFHEQEHMISISAKLSKGSEKILMSMNNSNKICAIRYEKYNIEDN